MARQEWIDLIEARNANDWLTGGTPPTDVAREWEATGLTIDRAHKWIDAGCFCADAAQKLEEAGACPKGCTAHYGSSGSWAYAVANGDAKASDAPGAA